MSESSSDDFSDIEYTQSKNVVTNNNNNDDVSDMESFGDFSPSANTKGAHNKIQNDNSDGNDSSFGSDEFEADPDSPPNDEDEDEDDDSSKAEDLMNDNEDITRGNKFGSDHIATSDNNNNMQDSNKGNDGNAYNPDYLYYNPRDYDDLTVNNEIRRLFEYIERFKYNDIELETQLKPFIPDYIPSIGNVDSFLKPTKTTTNYDKQENEEKLGIYYLDEPILNQSDPSTFRMKLNNESKQVSMNKHTKVSFIEDAERNPNKIRNWIDNFKKIKAKSLSNTVNIENLNNMPNIEELMEPFNNDKFNKYIKQRLEKGLDIIPSYKINLSLIQYAKIICNLLDIPIKNDDDINTSLHLLFSTYAALQST